MNGIVKKISIVAFIIALGTAGTAFAHGGWGGYGYGGRMMGPGYGMMGPGYGMMGPGYGGHMMGPGMMGYGPHRGWQGDTDDFNITRQQAEQLDAARDSFYQKTADLRDQIYEKNAQIRQELSSENPDRARLQDLQKALSKLESQMDQDQLDYMVEVRKIAPGLGRGFARGGYGPGAGYCWR
jgi:Spy/CpxP family protein refolding chaperone